MNSRCRLRYERQIVLRLISGSQVNGASGQRQSWMASSQVTASGWLPPQRFDSRCPRFLSGIPEDQVQC